MKYNVFSLVVFVFMCIAMQAQESQSTFKNEPITISVGKYKIEMLPVEGCEATQANGFLSLDSYYIGKTEVTQGLWEEVMGTNPSFFKSPALPVESVSWEDTQAFIEKLNKLTGKTFRLPNEFEWEFAAKGGNQSKGFKYSGGNKPEKVSWNDFNSGEQTNPVGKKLPNELGIYDMSGNVEEWCLDMFFTQEAKTKKEYGERLIKRYADIEIPAETTRLHVLKGGNWNSRPNQCTITARRGSDFGNHKVGFRLCMDGIKK